MSKKIAATTEASATEKKNSDSKPPTKIATILAQFVAGRSLNRFEAEWHFDHCLHSTVAALKKCGVVIDSQFESVPCVGGTAVARVKRYWMQGTLENYQHAHRLLDAWGVEPAYGR